jgi:hypothetical protein
VSVHLHIDRIVVEGLPLSPRDRRALGDAVQRELGVLLGAHRGAWPSADLSVRRVAGGPLPVPAARPAGTAGVGAVGTHIAGAIHAGIGTAVGR